MEKVKWIRKPAKKGSLRAINQGTRYDITGNLRRLARAIERGDHGAVKQVVVGVRHDELDGQRCVTTFGFGNETIPEMAYTVALMEQRLRGR